MTLSVNMIWMALCTALIISLQAGFTLMGAGFTREKNAGDIIIKNLLNFSICILLFWFIGFGIMFGKGNGFFGKIDFFSIGDYTGNIADGASAGMFIAMQGASAAVIMAVVTGAMAERSRTIAVCTFGAVMAAFIYPIAGHWTVGGGWLYANGFHDAAGACTVQMVAGIAAFIGAKLLGPRKGRYAEDGKIHAIPGQSLLMGTLGVFLLGIGWFGLVGQGGTARIGNVFLSTSLSVAAACGVTILYTTQKYEKPDISLILNGVMAGLVSISSGCDEVAPVGAIIIGIMAGILTVKGTEWIDRKAKTDDPIGAVTVFGLCGGAGTIATGFLSTDGGLLYGRGGSLLAVQIIGVAAVMLWVSLTSYITFRIIDHIAGLRVSEEEETAGLGISLQETPHDYVDLLPEVKEDADYENSLKATARDIPIDIAIPVRGAMPGSGNWDGTALTRVDILCRQSRFEALKIAMNRIGVTGMTVSQVLGCGMQKGAAEYYRGIPMDIQLLPKTRVEIVVAKIPVSKVVNCARKVLYTGHIGDGKIFIYDVRDAIKIRTGETGYDAMQGIEDVVS